MNKLQSHFLFVITFLTSVVHPADAQINIFDAGHSLIYAARLVQTNQANDAIRELEYVTGHFSTNDSVKLSLVKLYYAQARYMDVINSIRWFYERPQETELRHLYIKCLLLGNLHDNVFIDS